MLSSKETVQISAACSTHKLTEKKFPGNQNVDNHPLANPTVKNTAFPRQDSEHPTVSEPKLRDQNFHELQQGPHEKSRNQANPPKH
jgi:hypothetical protein